VAELLSQAEYEELAELRFQIRRFLNFSESAAHGEGIEPRHHQALLAIKAMPADEPCTVGALAGRLFLQHQSTVGLIDRMEQRQLVVRRPGRRDARQVLVSLTPQGERILERLSATHKAELAQSAPELARALRTIMRRAALATTE
jgi:DNA-binding MarR family transcriptional regulator